MLKVEVRRASTLYGDRYITRKEALMLPFDKESLKKTLAKMKDVQVIGKNRYISVAQLQHLYYVSYGCTLMFDNNFIKVKERKDPLINIIYGNKSYSLKNITLCTIAAFPDLKKYTIGHTVKMVVLHLSKKNRIHKEFILNRALTRDWDRWISEIMTILLEEKKIKKIKIHSRIAYKLNTVDLAVNKRLLMAFDMIKDFPLSKKDKATIDFIIYGFGYNAENRTFSFLKEYHPHGPSLYEMTRFVSFTDAKMARTYMDKNSIQLEGYDKPLFKIRGEK